MKKESSMRPITPRTLLGIATLLGAAACSSSSGGDPTKPADQLTYLHVAPTAPQLCSDSAGSYAVKGSGYEIALVFGTIDNPCPTGRDFLRLKLDNESLLKRPDGTPINDGDSVFISVVWAGGDSVLFRLQPSGLQLDPTQPGELRIRYEETEEADDQQVLQQAAIWRQELPGDPFTQLPSTRHEDSSDIETLLNGFSRYAIAY
jgi:hypothetical protein